MSDDFEGGLGIVFPGQGSQSLGMLSGLASAYPIVEQTFAEASAAVDLDLWSLAQQGPEEDLNRTENTQPALLAAGVAVWRAWLQQGGEEPMVVAGHSLGEYTALVAAGVLELGEATRLVALRGRLMQAAVPAGQGAMAAIMGLDLPTLEVVCKKAAEDGVVSPANLNAPGQIVIAGDSAAVDRAITIATDQGAKRAIPLAVSVPSHCALMKPAADELAKSLAEATFSQAAIPVLQNVDGQNHKDSESIRAALLSQLHQPVEWTLCVKNMVDSGAHTILECGPGKVLTGLMRRIDRSIKAASLSEPAEFQRQLEEQA